MRAGNENNVLDAFSAKPEAGIVITHDSGNPASAWLLTESTAALSESEMQPLTAGDGVLVLSLVAEGVRLWKPGSQQWQANLAYGQRRPASHGSVAAVHANAATEAATASRPLCQWALSQRPHSNRPPGDSELKPPSDQMEISSGAGRVPVKNVISTTALDQTEPRYST